MAVHEFLGMYLKRLWLRKFYYDAHYTRKRALRFKVLVLKSTAISFENQPNFQVIKSCHAVVSVEKTTTPQVTCADHCCHWSPRSYSKTSFAERHQYLVKVREKQQKKLKYRNDKGRTVSPGVNLTQDNWAHDLSEKL